MGNNNSAQCHEPDEYPEDKVNFFADFYGKNEKRKYDLSKYHDIADTLYEKFMKPHESEKHIEIFIDPKGMPFPYESDFFRSPEHPHIVSEDPKYIELVVCNDNLKNFQERFAIHKDMPDHDCKGNCPCIEEFITVNKGHLMRGGDDGETFQESESPSDALSTTSPMSPTTSDVETNGKGKAKKKMQFSPTSEEKKTRY